MIRSTPTPNPDAYLFQVQETLIPSGTYEFFHDQDLSDSPLAQAKARDSDRIRKEVDRCLPDDSLRQAYL